MQAQGFKVRLEDGSEVGPLDGPTLRDWRTKGLIGKATPVLPPGSRAWTTLGRVLDGAPVPARLAPAHNAATSVAGRSGAATRPARMPTSTRLPGFGALAGIALVVAAGATAYVTLGPELTALWPGRAATPVPVDPAPPALPHPTAGRDAALAAARAATPHLSDAAARALMDGSAAGVLDPPELFRRGWLQTHEGMSTLSRAETRELRALTGALYAPLTSRERRRLGAYIERVRARRTTAPDEDAVQAALVARAFARLSVRQQQRLQALLEKAVLASLGAPTSY